MCHPADADQPHRRPSPAEQEAVDDRGQNRVARAGPGDARLHRGQVEHQVVRRHHLHRRRRDVAVSGDGDRRLRGGWWADRSSTTRTPRWSQTRSRWPAAEAWSAASFSTPTGVPNTARPPSLSSATGAASGAAWAGPPRRVILPGHQARIALWRRSTANAQTWLELFRWLSYYDRCLRHSALGYLAPAEFE